jgi:hypothetical protein
MQQQQEKEEDILNKSMGRQSDETDLDWLLRRINMILNCGMSQKDTLETLKQFTNGLHASLKEMRKANDVL